MYCGVTGSNGFSRVFPWKIKGDGSVLRPVEFWTKCVEHDSFWRNILTIFSYVICDISGTLVRGVKCVELVAQVRKRRQACAMKMYSTM